MYIVGVSPILSHVATIKSKPGIAGIDTNYSCHPYVTVGLLHRRAALILGLLCALSLIFGTHAENCSTYCTRDA